MKIQVPEQLMPFSHMPGTPFMLPGTFLCFRIFPALIQAYDLSHSDPKRVNETPFPITGPVKDFTIQQNLEKGCLTVWGHSQEGYFKYHILKMGVKEFQIAKTVPPQPKQGLSKLSLGCHKAQDWTKILQRMSWEEILPFWFYLGQQIPATEPHAEGTAIQLQQLSEAIQHKQKEELLPLLSKLFLAGFEGGLAPRLIDNDHQGFQLPKPQTSHASPLLLLSEGSSLIKKLFIQYAESQIHILPLTPKEFHCGKLVGDRSKWGIIDLEWSKKTIRRLQLTATATGEVQFLFAKPIQRYRLNGKTTLAHAPLPIENGKIYTFDRFE